MSGCKYCFVRSCGMNSKRNPDKYFFKVPYNREIRHKWCVATKRNPDSLSYASAAYCCSDHFNMEVDLNRIASTRAVPVLRSDALPSLERYDNQLQIIDQEKCHDKSGNDGPKNLFVREVVYIEEICNDRFLEENNDIGDTLNIDCNGKDSMPDDDIEIIEDKNDFVVAPSVDKAAELPPPKKMIFYKNEAPINYTPLKNAQNKPVIWRHIQQLDSNSNKNGVKIIPISDVQPKEPPPKVLLGQAKAKVLHETAVYKSAVYSTVPTVRPPTASKPFAVNKSKYLGTNELKISKIESAVKQTRPPSDDDDDCVLVEEQNVLSNMAVAATTSTTGPLVTHPMTVPSTISIKSVVGGEATRTVQPVKRVVKRMSLQQSQPNNCQALVPVQSEIRVPNVSQQLINQKYVQNRVFSLIRLMISENEWLSDRHKGELIIARTKANEFKIANSIYYYRTSHECDNNYFVMDITEKSRYPNKTIERCYAIQWGNPRRKFTGTVNTGGQLDDTTKSYVFLQMKNKLFGDINLQNLAVQMHPAKFVHHDVVSHGRTPMNRLVAVKSNSVEASKTPIHAAHEAMANLDKNDHIKKMTTQSTASKYFAPPKAIKKISVQSPISTNAVAFNAFPTRPVIKILTSPEKANVKTPPRIKPKQKPRKVEPKNTDANSELIRLSQFLTPNIRKLINKLKYFEMDNGKVFTVKVGDSVSEDKLFNIVFTENKPQFLADIDARPVSKLLYVSKLVNYLFKAIYPYMRKSRNEPIPIPPPQDIMSDATPEVMEALLISESKRTYNEIAKLEASVNNSHATKNTSDQKHKCPICLQTFQRKYQLQRHQFVTHDSTCDEQTAETSTSPTANVLNAIPDTIKKAFHGSDQESCSSDLPLMTAIKTEKSDETIESDLSLLVPLYEESVNNGTLSIKEEPEVHFEEVTTLSTNNGLDQLVRQTAMTHFKNDDDSYDETDSAPECSTTVQNAAPSTRKGTITFEEYVALTEQRRKKEKRIAKVKDSERKRKVIRQRTLNDNRKTDTAKRIKISQAHELIKQWPALTVDLVDIKRE